MRPIFARPTAAATLALVGLLSAFPAHAQQSDEAKRAEAKKHMEAGAALYNDPGGHKCEEAYAEFKKAFDLSGSPNALKAMGVCALELERDGDAIAHYKKYLESKGDKIDAAEKAQIESDLKGLASVATVSISTDRQNVQIVDVRTPSKGYPITNKYVAGVGGLKLGIHPGSHVFTAKAEGAPDLTWSIEIQNGGSYEYGFEFDKGKPVTADGFHEDKPKPAPTQTERPVPTTVYIFGGLTVALVVPTVIFGVGALGKNSDYKDAQGTKPQSELDAMRSDVQTANLITDIFLGATVVSAAATAIFFFTRPEVTVEAPTATGWITVTPTVGRSGGGAAVVGAF